MSSTYKVPAQVGTVSGVSGVLHTISRFGTLLVDATAGITPDILVHVLAAVPTVVVPTNNPPRAPPMMKEQSLLAGAAVDLITQAVMVFVPRLSPLGQVSTPKMRLAPEPALGGKKTPRAPGFAPAVWLTPGTYEMTT